MAMDLRKKLNQANKQTNKQSNTRNSGLLIPYEFITQISNNSLSDI